MTTPPRPTRAPYGREPHSVGKRYVGEYASTQYDTNVRYVLEDIALYLERIANALEWSIENREE